MMRNPETLWLDVARGQRRIEVSAEEIADLRRAVQWWVLTVDPQLPEAVLDQLTPLPDMPADTAGRLLRDRLNKALLDSSAWLRLELKGRGLVIGVESLGEVEGFEECGAVWAGLLRAVLSPPPTLGWSVCRHCGESFVPQRSTAKFCGVNCRVAASKARGRRGA